MLKGEIEMILDPGFNPFLLSTYRLPSLKRDGTEFTSWAQVKAAIPANIRNMRDFSANEQDADSGYAVINRAVASLLPGLSSGSLQGSDAWNFMNTNVRSASAQRANPKWAWLPRSAVVASNSGSQQTPVTPVVTAPQFVSIPSVSNTTYKTAKIMVTLDTPSKIKADYGTSGQFTTSTGVSNSLSTTFTVDVTDLVPGTAYSFKITAIDAQGNQTISSPFIVNTQARPAKPPAPSNLRAENGSVILKWDTMNYELCKNIVIYRSTSGFISAPSGTPLATIGCDQITYHDEQVSPQTKYYYSVFTVDEYNSVSDPMNVAFTTNAASSTDPISTTTPPITTPVDNSSGGGSSGGGGGGGGGSSSSGGGSSSSSGGGGGSASPVTSSGGGGGGGGGGISVAFTATGSSVKPTTSTPSTPSTGSSAPTSSTSNGIVLPRTLSRGSTGDDVTSLQVFLIARGYLAPGNAIGSYGALTEAAVKKFQASVGIASSGSPETTGYGMAGSKTRAKITELSGGMNISVPVTTPASTPTTSSVSGSLNRTLSRGSSGSDVTLLQTFLITKGYLAPGNAIGTYGALTEAAVKRFQSAMGIVSSGTPSTTGYGMVGVKTRTKINELMK